jgi:subtilase family protein
MPLPRRQPERVTRTVTSSIRRTSVLAVFICCVLSLVPIASAEAGVIGRHATLATTQAKAAPTTARLCSVATTPGHYSCFALRRTDVAPLSAAAAARSTFTAQAGPAGFHPADLVAAYGLPSNRGGGQTVYIIDAYNDPNAEADLAVYRSQFGLPPCTTANGCFRKLNQNGATSPLPANNTGWSGEIALDLDMVSAICPLCHITLIEANDPSINMLAAVGQATSMGAKFVSMSWGGTESASAPTFDNAYFAPTGVVYAASSGDNGYAGGTIYPASSNRVIAVGGTSLSHSGNARGWAEAAWSGAGSGCSAYEAKPGWQSGIGACTKRAATDISADADPNTGVSVYLTYGGSGWAVYGGTSAAAPIVAAAYALAGPQPNSASPAKTLYAHRGRLNDVTSGSTGTCSPAVLCAAGLGWDGPTGLGTPQGLGAFTASRATKPAAVVAPYRLRAPTTVTKSAVISPFWGNRPVSTVVNAAVPGPRTR